MDPTLLIAFLTFGVLLLLVGLVGQVKAQQLEIGTKNPIARVIIGIIGIVFIAISISGVISLVPFPIPVLIPTSTPSPTDALPPIKGDAIVVLHNNSQATVSHVYFGCEQWGGWGGEQLSEPIPPGGTYTWNLKPGSGIYDLKATDSDQGVLNQQMGVYINGTFDWQINGVVVVLHNNSQSTISHVYFGSEGSWSGEQLIAPIPPGGTDTWNLKLGAATYDMKATDSNQVVLDQQLAIYINGTYDWYIGGKP